MVCGITISGKYSAGYFSAGYFSSKKKHLCVKEYMGGRRTKIIWVVIGLVFVLFLLLDITIIRAGRYTENETAPKADHAMHQLSCGGSDRGAGKSCPIGSGDERL